MNRCLKIAAVLIGTVAALSAWAGPPFTKQLIGDNGGFGVTAQGEWLMVGEPLICVVHVYKLHYGTMLYGNGSGTPGANFQIISAPEANGNCNNVRNRGFGEVVSLDGDLLVVGAPFAKGAAAIALYGETRAAEDGTVYLYQYDGTSWTQLPQNFEARNGLGEPLDQGALGAAGAEFGSAVAIDGDLMAIGSRAEGSSSQGAIYVYRVDRTSHSAVQVAKVFGENAGDALGSAVTIWQEQILAGAPFYDIPVPNNPPITDGGAAYLYEMEGDVPVLRDRITTNFAGFATPHNVGKEVSNGEFIGLLSGQAAYPVERNAGGQVVPKFEYTRSNGGDVSQSEGVSAFGILTTGVDIYPDVLNDNATQRQNYHLEIDLSGGIPFTGLAEDVKLYKEFLAVNDSANNRVQTLQFPCGYGGKLVANTWELVTVPCNVPPGTTVEKAFNADIFSGACSPTPCGVLGAYDVDWVVYGQNGDFTSPQPTVRLGAGAVVQPGRGYWIIANGRLKPGQPVYWNVDESNFVSPEDARIPLTTGSNPQGGPLASDVAGYYQVDLPDNIPINQTVGVLLGNPYGRSFRWSQSYVQLQGPINQALPVGAPSAVITAYIYNPDSTEGQPYDTVANTPGFSDTVPVNKGFWIRMNHGFLGGVTFGSLWLPYSK